MDYSEIPILLGRILRAIQNQNDCCPVFPGMVLLTSGGTDTFDTTATALQGSQYRSVSVSVISLTTGTVTVTDSYNTTNISYPGFSTAWSSPSGINPSLVIQVTGDAVALVTYSAI